MRIMVIDTSALLAAVLDEPEKGRLIELTQGVELLAPDSLHWEVGNALSALFKRGRLTLKNAKVAVGIYRQIPVHLVEVDLEKALEIAHESGIYAYDAYMITCALTHKAPLLTLDARLRKKALSYGISVVEV